MADEKSVSPTPSVLVPGVISSYGHGWRQIWKYFLELFLIGIIAVVISLPSGMSGWAEEATAAAAFLSFLAFIYSILVLGPVEYGTAFAFLKAVRNEKPEVSDMFEAFRTYSNAVLANLLVMVIVFIGLVLLIIPGIIFGCKLAFTPYLVVDRKMKVIDAVKTSWQMTGGHAWKVFLIGLLSIPIVIAGLICFGVGVVVSIMWVSAALASLYHAVSASSGASV